MLAFAIMLLVLAGGAALAIWLTRALQAFRADSDATLASRNAEVGRQLEGITATMDRRLGELDTKVDRRMEHASKQTNAIHRQLGDVGRATTLLAEHAKELGQLQQVLRPPASASCCSATCCATAFRPRRTRFSTGSRAASGLTL